MKKSKKKNQKKKSYKKKGGVKYFLEKMGEKIGFYNKFENAKLLNANKMNGSQIINNNGSILPSINLNVILPNLGRQIEIEINKTNIIPFWDLIQQKLYSLSIKEFFGNEFQIDNKVRTLLPGRHLHYASGALVPRVGNQFRVNTRPKANNSYKVGTMAPTIPEKDDFDELVNLSKITYGGLDETELNELKEIKSITYGGEAISKYRIFDPDDSYLNGMQNDATISVEIFYNEEDLKVQYRQADQENLGKIYYGNINIHKLIKRIKHALKSRLPQRPYIIEITKGETRLLGGDLINCQSDIHFDRIVNYNDPVENIDGPINVTWRLAEKKESMGYSWWDSEGLPERQIRVLRALYPFTCV